MDNQAVNDVTVADFENRRREKKKGAFSPRARRVKRPNSGAKKERGPGLGLAEGISDTMAIGGIVFIPIMAIRPRNERIRFVHRQGQAGIILNETIGRRLPREGTEEAGSSPSARMRSSCLGRTPGSIQANPHRKKLEKKGPPKKGRQSRISDVAEEMIKQSSIRKVHNGRLLEAEDHRLRAHRRDAGRKAREIRDFGI